MLTKWGSSSRSMLMYLNRLCCSSAGSRSEEHTSELQSPCNLVCRLLLEKKKKKKIHSIHKNKIKVANIFLQIVPCATVSISFNAYIVSDLWHQVNVSCGYIRTHTDII